ncbi:MAG: hypothetical protein IJP89_02380 [Synergistaceae bacterium]|nr:hypothetical protein [Synergistaceae bacterium]
MFERQLVARPSDVSMNGRMKLRALLDYFQDTAGIAVEGVEGTATELYARGYAWILTRYEIYLDGELPYLDDAFRIVTYHDPSHGYNTLRAFHVYSGESEIIRAKTSWLLIDVNTLRPVKPLAHIPGITSRDNEEIPDDFHAIPSLEAVTHTAELTVKYHDMDYNGHMNNSAYFEKVYDNAPLSGNLRRIYASFRSGAKLGETVTLEYGHEGGMMICRVKREGIVKPCAEFALMWGE